MNDRLGIETEGLRKSFGDVHALAGVDLRAPTGTVLGVQIPHAEGAQVLLIRPALKRLRQLRLSRFRSL